MRLAQELVQVLEGAGQHALHGFLPRPQLFSEAKLAFEQRMLREAASCHPPCPGARASRAGRTHGGPLHGLARLGARGQRGGQHLGGPGRHDVVRGRKDEHGQFAVTFLLVCQLSFRALQLFLLLHEHFRQLRQLLSFCARPVAVLVVLARRCSRRRVFARRRAVGCRLCLMALVFGGKVAPGSLVDGFEREAVLDHAVLECPHQILGHAVEAALQVLQELAAVELEQPVPEKDGLLPQFGAEAANL